MRIGFSNAGFIQGGDEFGVRLSVYLLVNVRPTWGCLGEFDDFEFGIFPCPTLEYITDILWEYVPTWDGIIAFSKFAQTLQFLWCCSLRFE